MKETQSFLLPLTILIIGLTACTKQVSQTPEMESADYKKAESFFNHQNDSAFYYFNKVATASKQPLEIAMSYNQMAVIQADAGDYFGSQESLSTSLRYLNPKNTDDHSCLASDYNELGLTSIKLKHYTAAVDYFDQALKYIADTGFRLSIINNKGLSYQRNGAYNRALQIYQTILAQATRKKTYARILTNMATTRWLANPDYNAVPELRRALNIRVNEKDRWGQNSSYAHLADYYIPNKPDSALFYAKAMLTIATEIESPDDRLEALDKLIRLSERPADAKGYFLRFTNLSDSVGTARNAAKNQFALIRYEVEKHKADNLKLQRDNTQKQYQVAGLALVILVVVSGAVMRYRKLRLEAQYKLRQNELKFSRKIHDVVANGLYRVMNEVEHSDKLDKEYLLDELEKMYEQSRDISYETTERSSNSFPDKVDALLIAFNIGQVKLAVSGNDPMMWQQVSSLIKDELEPIIQELMVNMSKHSQATHAVLEFKINDGALLVDYRDNGIGLADGGVHGNGLKSTVSRIEGLKGKLTFDLHAEKGLRLSIVIPLS
ncbi:MAG TPA: hypothetical protein VKB19_07755 [Pedobacter sp.]|nr:hypothetical protein [Pedobacter sp.]